jgi:UTP:GlnB (protein PII) uridylyltransferase
MDKATLLARVMDQVKHLKRRASEATQLTTPIPLDTDEVSVECLVASDGSDIGMYIEASVSCDDRPDLFAGLGRAAHGLGLRTVRAELTSLGGRVRHVFVLCREEEGSAGCDGLRALKEALWQALAKVASPDMVYGSSSITSSPPLGLQSKRPRILESHCSILSM